METALAPAEDAKGSPEDVQSVTESRTDAPDSAWSTNFDFDWECDLADRVIENIVPKAAQTKIESLTGVKLLEDIKRGSLNITSSSEECGIRALHKLEIMCKYHVSPPFIVFSLSVLTQVGRRS